MREGCAAGRGAEGEMAEVMFEVDRWTGGMGRLSGDVGAEGRDWRRKDILFMPGL